MLLVVDMQNGFITDASKHIVAVVKELVEFFDKQNSPVVFTRFVNKPDSPFVKWGEHADFMSEPENAIISELKPYVNIVFEKTQYSAFTDEVTLFIQEKNIKRIFICGIATNYCILKTAVDAFEKNIQPIVIEDACASFKSKKVHEQALEFISGYIGPKQIIKSKELLIWN